MLNHFPVGFEEFHHETIQAWGLSIGYLLDHLVNLFLYDWFAKANIMILCDQLGDVMNYSLYGLRSILVGFLGYPVEVIHHCVLNFLVGLSFESIPIPNLQDFVMGFSCNICSMKKFGVSLPFL